MATNPELLFDSIVTEANLQSLIGVPETLYSEFEQKRDSRDGVLSDDERRNFSKSLSAFGNSDGGVLIWGGCEDQKGSRS